MKYDFMAAPNRMYRAPATPFSSTCLTRTPAKPIKGISVWRGFAQEDMDSRSHPRSSSVAEILKHELLSERRFFGEFVGTPELPVNEVLPKTQELSAYVRRMEELARPRLAFFCFADSRVVDAGGPVLRSDASANLALLAPDATYVITARN